MATSTASLSTLLQSSTIDDHEEILKAANAALKSSKKDLEALHTRVVALLKLDRFHDVLRALDDGGDKLAERCVLEKAYALYKTGQLHEAEALVRESRGRGLKHVAAQTAYRLENFEDAARFYRELAEEEAWDENEGNDLRINSSAVDAQLEWQGKGDQVEPSRKKPGREDLDAFETSYNAACGCIARGDLSTGSMLLGRARTICEGLDELSDEEKRAEVLPIMVQQAFVLTKLGKLQEAEAVEALINTADVPEPPTRAIAQNNSLVNSSGAANPYIIQRIFSDLPKLSANDKHFQYQADILKRNHYTIELQALKYTGVAQSTSSLISRYDPPTIAPFVNSISVLNAAAHAHSDAGKAGLSKILELFVKRPNDIGLILTIIQLYVLTNNSGPAITLLESFFKRLEESSKATDQDVRFAPGLVALAVSLYRLAGRKALIKAELGKAASYWRRKSKGPASLQHAAGLALVSSAAAEDLSAAGEIFSTLRSQEPSDKAAIAGFIASYALSDYTKVTNDLASLPPISSLITGIDAEALEDAGIPSYAAAAPPPSKKRPLERTDKKDEVPVAKKTRTRPSRLPKDFEAGKQMDPERWLPLKDRSSYRPKGKKGKKKAMEATQGGPVREEESLELVGGAGTVKVEKANANSNANAKKGKGKKGKK